MEWGFYTLLMDQYNFLGVAAETPLTIEVCRVWANGRRQQVHTQLQAFQTGPVISALAGTSPKIRNSGGHKIWKAYGTSVRTHTHLYKCVCVPKCVCAFVCVQSRKDEPKNVDSYSAYMFCCEPVRLTCLMVLWVSKLDSLIDVFMTAIAFSLLL